jgi:dihydropteroate synthase
MVDAEASSAEQPPVRPAVWRCGSFDLPLTRPLVMGILNVTPDSFSDGGEHDDVHGAVEWGTRLVAEGADVLDVGGESTRPGARRIDPAEEARRIVPVIGGVHQGPAGVPISIDTRHSTVADAALALGASIVNDISGFRDPAMIDLASRTDAGLVVMHMRGEPGSMQEEPRYNDVLREVRAWLAERAHALEAAGVARDRIAIDPGIGFGKTAEHNLELLRRLPELASLGYPVLVGVSRKRFIGLVAGGEPQERLEGSLAAALWATSHGASIIRVHDVAATVKALAVVRAIETGSVPGDPARS